MPGNSLRLLQSPLTRLSSYPPRVGLAVMTGEGAVPRLPRVTAREAERAIMRDGWNLDEAVGSHRQYRHSSKSGYVTIAFHAGRIIDPKTLKSIIRQAGLTVDQFRALL